MKIKIRFIALLAVCSMLAWIPANAQTAWAATSMPGINAKATKNNVMKILNKYDKDGAYIMKKQMARGDDVMTWFSQGRIIDNIETAVHEETHGYSFAYARTGGTMATAYFIGSKKTIQVVHTKVYRSKKMAKTIPKKLRTFRYSTYIGKPTANLSSDVEGAYGLLNEFMAYRTGMHTILSLYPYYESQNADWETWRTFINECENDRLAYAEFKYYILHYLYYAKKHQPEVYKGIAKNKNFCKAYRQMESRYARQIKSYQKDLKKMKAFFAKQGAQMEITNNAITVYHADGNIGTSNGIGRQTTDYQKLQNEMKKGRYQSIHKALVKNGK